MSASTCCTGSFMLPATPHTNFTSPTLLRTHQGKSLTHKGEWQARDGRSEGGRRGCLEPCDARKWRGVGCLRYTPSGRVRGAGRRGPCLRPRPRLPAPRPCASCLPIAAPAIQKPTHRDGGGDVLRSHTLHERYMHAPSNTLHTPYIHSHIHPTNMSPGTLYMHQAQYLSSLDFAHTYTYTYIHAHMHTHTCTHTCTHMQTHRSTGVREHRRKVATDEAAATACPHHTHAPKTAILLQGTTKASSG